MRAKFKHTFSEIVSVENLLAAWSEFIKGKRSKADVQEYSLNLMDNILDLHFNLVNLNYRHSGYETFGVFDPKPRRIHKAPVRDRLLHHAVYRKLYPFFDHTFIADSYSCRIDKGVHAALERFRAFGQSASKNNTKTCWILKCDIKKFFANIDQTILMNILKKYIKDEEILGLLGEILRSFSVGKPNVGLPLGNLTSQLFVNIYMNKFDQFVKHKLKAEFYIRYADDFVIFSENKKWLNEALPKVEEFLKDKLKLALHENKVEIKTLASGVDFLGWVNFFDHRVLRTKTKRRMIKRIGKNPTDETMNSYRGLLSHGNTGKLRRRAEKEFLLALDND